MLAVSERTLLPVVLSARPIDTLGERLRLAVGDVLRALGIPDPDVEGELHEMVELAVGRTVNKVVLGSMADFEHLLDAHRGSPGSLLEVSLRLAETPCGDTPHRAS